jgi:hypothetical protein
MPTRPDKSFSPRYLRVLRASASFICAKILPSRCSKQSEAPYSGAEPRGKIAARTSPDRRLVSAIIHFDLAQRLLTPMCMHLRCIQTPCSTIYPQDAATDSRGHPLPGVQDMTRFLLAGAAALSLLTGVATAQTSETVTTTAPTPMAPPPPGTLSTTVTKKAVGPDGSLGYSQSSTYNSGTGVTNNTTTATYPPAPPPPPSVTTQQTTTTTTQPQ